MTSWSAGPQSSIAERPNSIDPGPRHLYHGERPTKESVLSDRIGNEPAADNVPIVGEASTHPPYSDDGEILSWVRIASEAAEDKLGQDTEAFFVGEIMAITDWFVITSGRNARQVRTIVEAVEESLTLSGGPKPVRIEGRDTFSWVLMDYGFFVVHVFTEESRRYYELERLWKDVPRLGDESWRPSA